jgi:hypothetical protein
MYRFTLLLSFALVWLGPTLHARSKPQPPPIGVCSGDICLTRLRWREDNGFGSTLPAVEGVLINNSKRTLSSVAVEFALKSGPSLRNTTTALYSGRIPPGASWTFDAPFVSFDGDAFITHIDTGTLVYSMTVDGVYQRLSKPIRFDPLFSPYNRRARKEWEKIHGKRKR